MVPAKYQPRISGSDKADIADGGGNGWIGIPPERDRSRQEDSAASGRYGRAMASIWTRAHRENQLVRLTQSTRCHFRELLRLAAGVTSALLSIGPAGTRCTMR